MKYHKIPGYFSGPVCLLLGIFLPGMSLGQSLTDKQIIDRMLATYSTASMYQDEGTVMTHFYNKAKHKDPLDLVHPDIVTKLTFSTAYIRSKQQFRFHYEKVADYKDCYTVAAQGKQNKIWWTVKPSPYENGGTKSSVVSALGIAAGISSTSSCKIPALLFNKPINGNWAVRDVKNWHRTGQSTQDNRLCYRFKGIANKKDKVAMYIDRQRFLILRFDVEYNSSNSLVKSSMTYKPHINESVPENAIAMVNVCANN